MELKISLLIFVSLLFSSCTNENGLATEHRNSIDDVNSMDSFSADSLQLESLLECIDSLMASTADSDSMDKLIAQKSGILWMQGRHDASLAVVVSSYRGDKMRCLKAKSFCCWVKNQTDSARLYADSALRLIEAELPRAAIQRKTTLLHDKFDLLLMMDKKDEVKIILDTLIKYEPDYFKVWTEHSFDESYAIQRTSLVQFQSEYRSESK